MSGADLERTVLFDFSSGTLKDYIASCASDFLWPVIQEYIPNHSYILEAGGGSGKWLAFLASQGYSPRGIELNAESVLRFKLHFPSIPYEIGDIEKLPYATGKFDAILSLGVLEHLVWGMIPALEEKFRVLKENGCLIVTVPHANKIFTLEKIKDRLHYVVLGSRLLRKLLKRKPVSYSKDEKGIFCPIEQNLESFIRSKVEI